MRGERSVITLPTTLSAVYRVKQQSKQKKNLFISLILLFQYLLSQVMESISSWQVSMSVYILIVAVPLLLLCLIRSLKYLATFSLAADMIIGIYCKLDNIIIYILN